MRLPLLFTYLNWLSLTPAEEGDSRWVDDFVEDGSAVDEQSKTNDLQPLKCLPSESQADEPDEERSASVDGASSGGGDGPRNAETEEIEATAMESVWRLSYAEYGPTYPIDIMIKSEVNPIEG